jgi:hypothetical protein
MSVRLLLAGSGLPLGCDLGGNDLWLPLLAAGKKDCFAAFPAFDIARQGLGMRQ